MARVTQLEKEKSHLSMIQRSKIKGITYGSRGFSSNKCLKNSTTSSTLKAAFFCLLPISVYTFNKHFLVKTSTVSLSWPSITTTQKEKKRPCTGDNNPFLRKMPFLWENGHQLLKKLEQTKVNGKWENLKRSMMRSQVSWRETPQNIIKFS